MDISKQRSIPCDQFANFLLIVIVIVLCGCGDYGDHDISNDPRGDNFKDVMGVWKTKIPTTLCWSYNQLSLYTWQPNRDSNTKVLANLPSGTQIKIERLNANIQFEVTLYEVRGTLLDGPYKGKVIWLDFHLFKPNNIFHNAPLHKKQSPQTSNNPNTQPATEPDVEWAVNPEMLER